MVKGYCITSPPPLSSQRLIKYGIDLMQLRMTCRFWSSHATCPNIPPNKCRNFNALCCNSSECGKREICCQTMCKFECIEERSPDWIPRYPEINLDPQECKNRNKTADSKEEDCQVIYSQFSLAIHHDHKLGHHRFVEWAQNEIVVVPDFHKPILFSDEAHFWLNDYVNKQNCRIWSDANPQVYVETPLHPEKLTVWCALWAGGIIGPYFFKNDEGHNVTVNGDRYRAMITNFFIPELNNHDVQELWFQQDGATCHTARAPINLLKDTFGDRLISRFGPVNWPPRSCDLTPLDYFL
ncbi:uncharacterized protein TNCV_4737121 [Trichonephila clavipes]|nr:uncharacterized protein TNCV_4737121 [Trichonephila clavipes]